jgi:hypothetical protein
VWPRTTRKGVKVEMEHDDNYAVEWSGVEWSGVESRVERVGEWVSG